MHHAPYNLELDVAIIGGGIAGLWLINSLTRAGYDAALFESQALGSHQTMASQGMIHGGLKYSLGGQLTGATRAISDMPMRWRRCLEGTGELNLDHTKILSDGFHLWSTGGLGADLQAMLASRALHGHSQRLSAQDRPALLKHPDFRGTVYRLEDLVLDLPSLVGNLATNVSNRLVQVPNAAFSLNDGRICLTAKSGEATVNINARRFVFTAGRGNAALLTSLGLARPPMQLRPLQQVMVKHPALKPFYGHCLGRGTSPRLTISSHTAADGDLVWYLGGQLAEAGAGSNPDQLIAHAQAELEDILPWLDLTGAQWRTLAVDRAEPAQPGSKRPDGARLSPAPDAENLLVGWPTKLTLVPNLADRALAHLREANIEPSGGDSGTTLSNHFAPPPLARPPWDSAFGAAHE